MTRSVKSRWEMMEGDDKVRDRFVVGGLDNLLPHAELAEITEGKCSGLGQVLRLDK